MGLILLGCWGHENRRTPTLNCWPTSTQNHLVLVRTRNARNVGIRQFISFCGAWVGLNDRSEEYQWQFRSRLHPRSKPYFLLSTVASALLAHAGPTIVNTNSSLHQILPGHLLLQLADSSFQKKWRCPKLGVALYNPFGSRIFHYKLYLNHPAMGYPHDYGNPQVVSPPLMSLPSRRAADRRGADPPPPTSRWSPPRPATRGTPCGRSLVGGCGKQRFWANDLRDAPLKSCLYILDHLVRE